MAVRWKFLETNSWKVCIEYNSTFKYQSGWPCLSQGALTGGAPPRVYWLVPSLPTMHSHSHRFPFSPLSSHPVLSTFFNLLPSTLPNFPAACHSFSPFPLRASFIFFFRPRTSFFGVAPLADIGIRLEPPLLRFLHPPSLCLSFSSSYSLRFQTSFLSYPPTSNDQFFRSFVTSSKYSSIFRISPSDSQTHCQFRAFPSTNICKFDLVSVLSLLSTSFSLRTRA